MKKDGTGQYAKGVDSRKGGWGDIFTAVDEPSFPHAFCKIYIDPVTGRAFTQQMDGVGSKSVQRYLHARETGDYSVCAGDADDCFVMNAGDVAAAGLMDNWVFTDIVAINQNYVDKEAYLTALNQGFLRIKQLYAQHGQTFLFTGGETADLVDQTRNMIFDGTITAYADKKKVITGDEIKPGDIIIGVRSGGPCNFEKELNSGHMSNGSTGLRHMFMRYDYQERYPEIVDPEGDDYIGRFCIGDEPEGLGMEISQALMSPTRHFPIIVKKILERYGNQIHGIVLNTGGGATKCTRIGSGIRYVKSSMPKPDPLFLLAQEESGKEWGDMFESYNMGVGLDLMVPESIRDSVTEMVENEFGVGCQEIGVCEKSKDDKNHVVIDGKYGTHEYDEE